MRSALRTFAAASVAMRLANMGRMGRLGHPPDDAEVRPLAGTWARGAARKTFPSLARGRHAIHGRCADKILCQRQRLTTDPTGLACSAAKRLYAGERDTPQRGGGVFVRRQVVSRALTFGTIALAAVVLLSIAT